MGLHGLGEVNANAQCSGTEQVGGATTRPPPLHACCVRECRAEWGLSWGTPRRTPSALGVPLPVVRTDTSKSACTSAPAHRNNPLAPGTA